MALHSVSDSAPLHPSRPPSLPPSTGGKAPRRTALRAAAILLGLVGASVGLGQGLTGLGNLPGQSTVQVFAIDPSTGGTAPILSTGATALTGAPIAFDPTTRRLFFEDGSSLWTVNLATGADSHVPLASCCPALQFDSRQHLLLGVGFLPGQSTVQIFAIEPSTGDTTPILSTGATALTGAPIAFDPITRRLFFEDGSNLWTANLTTGVDTHVPLTSCCPFLQYDTRENLLLGVGFLPGQSTVQVFTIEPSTGGTSPIVTTGAAALSGAPIAFDPITRRLFFEDGSDLWTANLATGADSHVPLASCCPFLFFAAAPSAPVPFGPAGMSALAIALAAVAVTVLTRRADSR